MATPEMPDAADAASGSTIMHRKARAGRAEHRARAMSLVKALRITCAKVADRLLDLPLAAISVRSEPCPGEALRDRLDEAGLLMLLDGPMGSRGGAAFDPGLVTALIQQETMGRVLPAADEAVRRPTATDAAICAPFLDWLLAEAAVLPDDAGDQRLIAGFAFGAWVEDARVLGIALDAPSYEVVQLTLDIAQGARQGQVLLCLPHAPAEVLPEALPADPAEGAPAQTPGAFAETLQNLRAELRVALAQLRLPLGRLGALKAGDCLDLGRPDFAAVRVQSFTGQTVSRAMLGQIDGQRAVQVGAGAGDLARAERWEAEGATPPDIEEAAAVPVWPDQDDLPGDMDLPEMADLPELSDLPELPDMSDLPDLDDLPALPRAGAG